MKAVVCTAYGPPEVLQVRELPKPTPRAGEVLVRIHATTVHVGDVRIRSFSVPRAQWIFARLFLGIFKPRKSVLGMELAGEIAEVGSGVTGFEEGDPVFGFTGFGFGAYAEYICLPAEGGGAKGGFLAHKPAALSYGEAAPIAGGGITALLILRLADIQPGHRVLIYGASGSVGTYAVQIAKSQGAEVTAVCSTRNLDLVRSLGADNVLDYTKEDFTESGETYDVVFDAVDKFPPSRSKTALKPSGVYLNAVASSDGLKIETKDLLFLKELVEAGELKTVVDRCFSLDQIAEGHRYVEKGHKVGNVIITVSAATSESELEELSPAAEESND